MFICIPKEKIDEFKRALKDKELDIFELMKMSTDARTAFFEKFAGDNAKTMNTLFEEKLILKNRIQGIKNWANKVGEMGRYDPAKQAKLDALISEYKARQQERMFNPKEEEGFLADLVEEKLGVRISKEQAKTVFDIQMKADELFDKYQKQPDYGKELKDLSPESQKIAAEMGATKVMYKKYLDNLKSGNLPVKGMIKAYSQEIKDLWKESKYEATKKIMSEAIFGLWRTTINAVSSWDNSWMGRQGAITLIKSPKTWWNMATKSMSDFYQTLKGQNPEDTLMSEIYSDPDYINGNYEKAKLDFGIEEEVPTQILERTPVLGRIFKASDISFTDSAIRARRGLFKIMKKVYEAKGTLLDDVVLKDMGNVINAITARGKVGRIGTSAPVQILMWAPRMLKADWDVLTGHTFGFGLETKFARVQTAKTVFNVVVATAAVTAIAKAMGAQVETNPISTDFLKIKIGNTRINTPFARGMPQIVTLFARLITQKTKSSSGVITSLNSGEYGSRTLLDVGIDFLKNKTTPPSGAVLSWMEGKDFTGKKPTLGSTAFNFLPISVQNFIQLKDDASTQAVFGAFMDLFGIGVSTYKQETDWAESTGAEIRQFHQKVGEAKFKQANDLYNQKVSDWMVSIKKNNKFNTLSEDDKQTVITKKKAEIKSAIFKQYGFVYQQTKSKPLPKF